MNDDCTQSLESLKGCSNYAVSQDGSWAFPTVSENADLVLYVPGNCSGDHITDGPENVHYFAIVSKKMKQPVFTLWASPKKNLDGLKTGRPKVKFNTCCITGVTQNDYSGTGFSKGHQVASADMATFDQAKSTFTTCNMCPQNEVMNGRNWASLENGARSCVSQTPLAIYTGPVFEDGGKYCMKSQVCSGNDCNKFLSPKGDMLDWYTDPNYYDICENGGITVPTAFFKVICTPTAVYPIIMGHEVPGQGSTNAKILASGAKAWSIITNALQTQGISLPTSISSKVVEFNSSTWLGGQCPITADSSMSSLSPTTSSSTSGDKTGFIPVGVALLLLIIAVILLKKAAL